MNSDFVHDYGRLSPDKILNADNSNNNKVIENYFNKAVKIYEAQTGPILKESDIVRYQDIYGRTK